jgi:hypothetical protein
MATATELEPQRVKKLVETFVDAPGGVTLTLSHAEARFLRAILYSTVSGDPNTVRRYSDAIGEALNGAGYLGERALAEKLFSLYARNLECVGSPKLLED